MNVELLRKVQQYILAEPKRFNLDVWGMTVDPDFYEELMEDTGDYEEDSQILLKDRPPCGAIGCIAGNTCIVNGNIIPSKHWGGAEVYEFPADTLEIAAGALDIDRDQARKLFYLTPWGFFDDNGKRVGWPQEFEERLDNTVIGTIEYAQVAVDRIEHFINTGE